MVAGRALAEAALFRTMGDRYLCYEYDPKKQQGTMGTVQEQRRDAIQHVIDNGQPYWPLIEKWSDCNDV